MLLKNQVSQVTQSPILEIKYQEHDSSEKESQELEDSKDKKVELRLIHEDLSLSTHHKRVAIYGGQYLKSDITIDTHNPPPQLI